MTALKLSSTPAAHALPTSAGTTNSVVRSINIPTKGGCPHL
jgi:hypothetical protein